MAQAKRPHALNWVLAALRRMSSPPRHFAGTLAEMGPAAWCEQSGISVLEFHVPICATEQSTGDVVDIAESAISGLGVAGIVVDRRGFFQGDSRSAARLNSSRRYDPRRASSLSRRAMTSSRVLSDAQGVSP
jgi:hypothetical protein